MSTTGTTITVIVVLAGAGLLAIALRGSLPELARYLKIRRM